MNNLRNNLFQPDAFIIPAVSHYSYPNMNQDIAPLTDEDINLGDFETLWKEPANVIAGYPRLIRSELLNNKRHVLAENNEGLVILFDIIQCCILKEYRDSKFCDVLNCINTKESLCNWCLVDIRSGVNSKIIFH